MNQETPPPVRKFTALPGRGSGEMSYLDFGDPARPADAVFVHANGFNAQTYRTILGPLARRYRILAIDQRGHGSTSLDTDTSQRRNWQDICDDLLAFLQALELSEVVLAGHSMGGTASLMAAATQPDRCARLALFDPVIVPQREDTPTDSPMIAGALRRRAEFPSREEAVRAYRGRGAFRTWPDAVLEDYVAGGFRDLPQGGVTLACEPRWEASNFSVHDQDTWSFFKRCPKRIEVLRAAEASTFQMHDPRPLPMDRMSITTVPGSTHFLPMERPELVRAVLTGAIEARLGHVRDIPAIRDSMAAAQ